MLSHSPIFAHIPIIHIRMRDGLTFSLKITKCTEKRKMENFRKLLKFRMSATLETDDKQTSRQETSRKALCFRIINLLNHCNKG